MNAQEYKSQYKFPKNLRSCFVTRKDWPNIIAWISDNKLWGPDLTEDALFRGDSDKGDTRYNCLLINCNGIVLRWGDGARDAKKMEADMLKDSCWDKSYILSASLFRIPQVPPPELDF